MSPEWPKAAPHAATRSAPDRTRRPLEPRARPVQKPRVSKRWHHRGLLTEAPRAEAAEGDEDGGPANRLRVDVLAELNAVPQHSVQALVARERRAVCNSASVRRSISQALRTVFPGLGAGFLNLGGKMERTAKKWGKNEQKWARNGLKRVGAS